MSPHPIARRERFELLDALRGFALLGVLLVNLRDLTLFDLLPAAEAALLPTAPLDRGLSIAFAALIDGKAFTVFTVLFGVGFALQMQRATDAGHHMRRYVRRLLVLLVIGLVHGLLWWGDILRLYAVLGLLLVPLWRLNARTLAWLGFAVAVTLTPFLRPLMNASLPAIAPAPEATAAALAAFRSENIGVMLAGNLSHDLWSRISAWGLPFYVLGRLLIGAALGKSGALQDAPARLQFWRRLLFLLLPIGIALTTFLILREHGLIGFTTGWWRSESARGLLRMVRSAAPLALGLAYVAAFVLAFQHAGWRRWLRWFAPVGRMALTNYLAQTLIGLAIFYGVGFGIGPRFGLVGIVATAAVIFAVQIFASRWWLARYHFGPVEWVWRSLTYGTRPPMRRQ